MIKKLSAWTIAFLTIANLFTAAPASALVNGQLGTTASGTTNTLQRYSGSINDGMTSSTMGAIYSPVSDAQGNYYAIGGGLDGVKIIKFSPQGKLIRTTPIPAGYSIDYPQINIDKQGNIYISTVKDGYDEHFLMRLNVDGDLTLTIAGLESLTNNNPDASFISVFGTTIDNAGTIYITTGYFIAKFSSSGTLISTTPTAYDNGDEMLIQSIAMSNDDKLFATVLNASTQEPLSQLVELNLNGQIIRKFDNGTKFPVGSGLAVDGNNNLYALSITSESSGPVQCAGMDFALRKYSNTGTYLGNIDTSAEASEGPVCSLYGVGASSAGLGISTNGDILLGSGNHQGEAGEARIVKYSYPKNQAVFAQNSHTAASDLTILGNAEIISATNNTLKDIGAPADAHNQYPLGLVHFIATVDHTNPITVELLFATDLQPSQVVARKYNGVTKQYGDIPGAVVTTATLNNKPALKLSYPVRDGGELDEDGAVNGTIVDPVGLAVAEQLPLAPNTGYEQTTKSPVTTVAGVLITSSVALIATLLYRKLNPAARRIRQTARARQVK